MAQRVCIIGGGVIGLATAYALVRDGFEVTVIEARDALGSETSFANGGQLSYRYVAPLADAGVPLQAIGWMLRGDSPLKLRRGSTLRSGAGWRLFSALAAARSTVRTPHTCCGWRCQSRHIEGMARRRWLAGFQWRRNGKLVTFRSAPASSMHARGWPTLSSNRCCRRPSALNLSRPWPMHPLSVRFIRRRRSGRLPCFLPALGYTVASVRALRVTPGASGDRHSPRQRQRQRHRSGEQVLPVDQLVIAAGHRSPLLALPGLQLPLYPLKGYSLTVPIGPDHQAPDVSITDYDRKIVYARIGEQLRVAAMVDIVGFDPAIDPKRLALIKRQAVTPSPMPGPMTRPTEWAGMRPATPSGVPLLGATAYRNLWLNIGHGALGFTLACGSGRLLSELIGQRRPSIDMHGFTTGPPDLLLPRGHCNDHYPTPQQPEVVWRRDVWRSGISLWPSAG